MTPHPILIEAWLERAGCAGEDAVRVRELVADRTDGDRVVLDRIVIRAARN